METEFVGFVVVGAGVAGLATALALHRVGIRSIVLERAECLRSEGGALAVWTNAWKALTALGVADLVREQHPLLLQSYEMISLDGAGITRKFPLQNNGSCHELRCVKRAVLLEVLATALPPETIKLNCKVLRVRQCLNSKYSSETELEDGTIIRAKGVIGCDGVMSIVGQGFLDLLPPATSARCGIRGLATYSDGHHLDKYQIHFLNGVMFGRIPINDKELYWFTACSPPPQDYSEIAHDPLRIREFGCFLVKDFPEEIKDTVSRTESENLSMTVLRFRSAWIMLTRRACKGSVTVAGDAVHPMTPDIGQGGCSALEDAVVLARCLASAGLTRESTDIDKEGEIIEEALNKYVDERKWRWIWLLSQSYITGFVQQGSSAFVRFVRDKIILKIRSHKDMFVHASYDCGNLPV